MPLICLDEQCWARRDSTRARASGKREGAWKNAETCKNNARADGGSTPPASTTRAGTPDAKGPFLGPFVLLLFCVLLLILFINTIGFLNVFQHRDKFIVGLQPGQRRYAFDQRCSQ